MSTPLWQGFDTKCEEGEAGGNQEQNDSGILLIRHQPAS